MEVIKHASLHCMEEVGLREVTHDTGNMLEHVESSVNLARREFASSCPGVGITERYILVVIPPGGLLSGGTLSPSSFFGHSHQKQTCRL